MTLILTLVTPLYVEQVADRLVSAGGRSWDPASNKTIVFVATNGIGVASYTGAAHLVGHHTDERIASAIAGTDLARERFATQIGGYRVADIGLVAIRIAGALDAAFVDSQLDPGFAPAVVMSGWTWRRVGHRLDRIRPFLWRIVRLPGGRYHIHRDALTKTLTLNPMPAGWIDADQGRRLLNGIAEIGPVPDDVRGLLATHIAGVSANNAQVVGDQLMAVRIPTPLSPRLVDIAFMGRPSPYGTYLPWVIGEKAITAPSIVTPGTEIPFGRGYGLSVSGPTASPGAGVVFAMESQDRKPIPGTQSRPAPWELGDA